MTRNMLIITLGLVACAGEAEQPTARLGPSPAISVAELADRSQEIQMDGLVDTDAATPAEVWTPIGEEIATLGENVGNEEAIEITAEEAPAPIEASEFELRRGETLAHFARWSGMTVESVASSSELDLDGSYPVGTVIRLNLGAEQRSTLEASRDEHHQKRVEGYLASRGGSTGSEFYTVRSGDNAWVIAKNSFGIPVWLLESYNPSVDLDNLRPGQSLMVPVIDDVVVSAD